MSSDRKQTYFKHLKSLNWQLDLFFFQLVGILLSQILINQIQDQIKLQNYNQKHRSDPWSWNSWEKTKCVFIESSLLPEVTDMD